MIIPAAPTPPVEGAVLTTPRAAVEAGWEWLWDNEWWPNFPAWDDIADVPCWARPTPESKTVQVTLPLNDVRLEASLRIDYGGWSPERKRRITACREALEGQR